MAVFSARAAWAACTAPRVHLPSTAAVAAAASLDVVLCRTYFSTPTPSWERSDIRAQMVTRSGRNPAKPAAPLGLGITGPERQTKNSARHNGFLVADNGTKQSACNHHLRFCYFHQRPYIAVNKHGDEVHVLLEPVLGLGDESAKGVLDVSPAKAFDATLSGMGQVLSANSVQWWNKQDKPDIEAAKESGQDGSNAGKAAPTRLSSSFVVYTAGRSASFALAAQLNEAYCSATGAWTPQQALQQRKASQEQRRAKHYRKVLRRAVKLGSAPVRHQNVPPASLDALMAAHAAGEVDVRSLPQQQPLA